MNETLLNLMAMGWWHINHVVQLNSNSCDKIRGITFLFSKPFTNVGSSPSTALQKLYRWHLGPTTYLVTIRRLIQTQFPSLED